MIDLERQLASLRSQAEQSRRAQAAAEARRQQAEGAVAGVQQTMAAEFPELAQRSPEDLLAALEQQAATEVTSVQQAIQAAGGAQ
jgi:hypothetical protein